MKAKNKCVKRLKSCIGFEFTFVYNCGPKMIFRSNVVQFVKLNPKLMPDFRHKCLSQRPNCASIRWLTSGSEPMRSAEEAVPKSAQSMYDAAKYTQSDAHLKHKAYQNFRCESSDETIAMIF